MKKRKADLNLSADESLDNHSEVIDSLYEEIKMLKVLAHSYIIFAADKQGQSD